MRNTLKTGVTLLFTLLSSPVFVSFILIRRIADQDRLIAGYSQFLSLFPGQLGNYLRKCSLQFMITHCSTDAVISFGVLLSQQDTEIHQGTYIGPQCNIGRCTIGANCLLGSGVHLMSGKKQHNFEDLDTPIREQGGHFDKITIGEDTWIGNGALVMANVGKKCVIAAGSVVTQDVEDYCIVAGNPARVIKSRKVN